MSQIRNGKLTAVNGSPLFTADAGVDWSDVEPGFLFIVGDFPVFFEVQSCNLVGGVWKITATANFAFTGGLFNYVIVLSYTPKNNIPVAEQGDVKTLQIFQRAIKMLAALAYDPTETPTGNENFTTQGGKTLKTQGGKNVVKQHT